MRREIGRSGEQGRAFGLLDGGRGLASACIASLAAWAFTLWVGSDAELDGRLESLAVGRLILSYAGYCVLSAACVWFFVPDPDERNIVAVDPQLNPSMPLRQRLRLVLSSPAIWLQAVVILAAYSAFKMLDNYGLYAEDAYGLSRSDSAKLIANVSYVRVVAALSAGWIADKLIGVRATIQLSFGLLLIAYAGFLLTTPSQQLVWLLGANMVVSCAGFFALRGIYFALLDDAGIPQELTGTAVGIISFIGYMPEIYMGPLTGWLIREARADGDVLRGYQSIFTILTLLCLAGILAAFLLRWAGGPAASNRSRSTGE